MILKLRMPTHTATCGWRIMDRVARVDYEFVDKTSELRERAEKACFMWIESYPVDADSNSEVSKAGRKKIVEVCVVFEDYGSYGDRHEMFYTDDMVYIMNNEGKTCDRINF